MDRLFEAFPDKYPRVLREEADTWVFELRWPESEAWYVDPNLTKAAQVRYRLPLGALTEYVEHLDCGAIPFVFSMFHSRALLAPALASKRDGRVFDTIVHVDAHDDLMPALVRADNAGVSDALRDVPIDFVDTASVTAAINSGAISKGSFLTAYLAAARPAKIVHINPFAAPGRWFVRISKQSVDIGGTSFERTAVTYSPDETSDASELNEVSSIPNNLTASQVIWLDVDLDAFCNRYDGDSDRRHVIATPKERKELEQRIAAFRVELERAEWRSRVQAISVAASPGFFPSEYWSEVIPWVCDGLVNLFCRS
jgi:hypothetical protein